MERPGRRSGGDLRNAIVEATARIPFQRIDDADVWFECLYADLTEPDRKLAETVSPLQAQKGDRLAGGLTVVGVLGHGASARGIEVERDGQPYALKVSIGPDHDGYLKAEGEVLARLRHPSIVPLRDVLFLTDHVCLLLGLAGAGTLQRHLTDEGPLAVEAPYLILDLAMAIFGINTKEEKEPCIQKLVLELIVNTRKNLHFI